MCGCGVVAAVTLILLVCCSVDGNYQWRLMGAGVQKPCKLYHTLHASRLATRGNCSESHATCLLYGRLSLTLMRANARALLSRAGSSVEHP